MAALVLVLLFFAAFYGFVRFCVWWNGAVDRVWEREVDPRLMHALDSRNREALYREAYERGEDPERAVAVYDAMADEKAAADPRFAAMRSYQSYRGLR